MIERLRNYWHRRRINRPQSFSKLRDYWREHTSRRRFIKGALAAGSAGVVTAGYARLWEPGRLEVNQHKVPLGDNTHPIRLLHLSDLHASRVVSLNYLRHSLNVGLEQKPDLICLTGDYITWKYRRYNEYAEMLSMLSAAAPTFACLGNHDGGKWAAKRLGYPNADHVRSVLAKAGITLLHNEARGVKINERVLNLVGMGDIWNGEFHPEKAFPKIPEPGANTIALSHNPDTKQQLANYSWDLLLCGHTHGGQLYVPGLGAPLAPVRDKRYVRGLHHWNDRWLHITKGVGNLHGVRLNCRPEVSLLTLT